MLEIEMFLTIKLCTYAKSTVWDRTGYLSNNGFSIK